MNSSICEEQTGLIEDFIEDFQKIKVKDVALTVTCIGIISVADIKINPFISNIATQNLGFCLGYYYPRIVQKSLIVIINPIVRLNNRIASVFVNNYPSR